MSMTSSVLNVASSKFKAGPKSDVLLFVFRLIQSGPQGQLAVWFRGGTLGNFEISLMVPIEVPIHKYS